MIDPRTAENRIRVLHVVTGLGRGGAETSLLRTVVHADTGRFVHRVVSLVPGGELVPLLREAGIEVRELAVPLGVAALLSVPRLRGIIKDAGPDVIQTWMYHSDFLGGLAARVAGNPPVVWGLHHANLDPDLNKRSTLRVARACARLSRSLPAAIVCCSEATRRVHAAFGYDEERMRVIPNGYEVTEFQPDPDARNAVRAEWGLAEDDTVIGMVARYHPLKDHRNFLAAARGFRDAGGRARFILCGRGVHEDNEEFMALVDSYGLRDDVRLLGERDDVPRIMNAFDVGTISSAGEGFPNVVCEMMLCGLPCVVTDVGDAALIVGDTGCVAPPSDPAALTEGWRRTLQSDLVVRRARGLAAREKIIREYSAQAVSDRYHRLWSTVAGG